MTAVQFSNVSKSYPIYAAPGDRLKELVTLNRRSFHRDYWALRDVSFEVPRGQTFCLIGENGCGKSTTLQICAGILQPTAGSFHVQGRIAALLELGTGFNPEFTGRDNVMMNAAILGLSHKEIEQRFPDIVEFAEIGDFMDQPVKTYSTGMVVRLAFSVAINVDPEVLLVDEALAVGDLYFRQRCLRKVHDLRARGVTILFVSHSTAEVKALGDQAVWLDHGQIRAIGKPDSVVSQYMAAMAEKDNHYQAVEAAHHVPEIPQRPADIIEGIPNIDHRYGDGRAKLLGIAVCDPNGQRLQSLESDTEFLVRISFRAAARLERPIVGITFRDHRGLDIAGSNTDNEGAPLPPLDAGQVCTVDFHLRVPAFYSTSLSLSPAVANGSIDRHAVCDWIDNAIVIEMTKPEGPIYGHLRFPCRIVVNAHLNASEPSGVTAA